MFIRGQEICSGAQRCHETVRTYNSIECYLLRNDKEKRREERRGEEKRREEKRIGRMSQRGERIG